MTDSSPNLPEAVAGYVALTFDDGSNENTATLLETLRACGARATLFNIGENAAAHPDLVRAEVDAGMWIGNHSYVHPHMLTLGDGDMRDQLSRTQSAIERPGGGTPILFRPPFGEHDPTLDAIAAELGMRVVMWAIDTRDWDGATAEAIVAAAEGIAAGEIILMHDGYAATNAAIPIIVGNLAKRGLLPGMIDPASGRAVAPR